MPAEAEAGIQQEAPAEAGTEQEEAPVEAGTEQEVPRGYGDRAEGVVEDCAVGDCGAGYGPEEVEPPRDGRSVPTLDVLPLTDSRASSDGLLDPPLLLCGRRSGRRGHRTLAGDAAGHEPRGTRSPAPSCSRPPPPKVRTRHPRLLHQFSVFFVMFASDF